MAQKTQKRRFLGKSCSSLLPAELTIQQCSLVVPALHIPLLQCKSWWLPFTREVTNFLSLHYTFSFSNHFLRSQNTPKSSKLSLFSNTWRALLIQHSITLKKYYWQFHYPLSKYPVTTRFDERNARTFSSSISMRFFKNLEVRNATEDQHKTMPLVRPKIIVRRGLLEVLIFLFFGENFSFQRQTRICKSYQSKR